MSQPIVLRTDAELNMGGSWPASSAFRFVTAEDDRPETLLRLAPDADLIYTCYAPITREVIAAAPRLRGIVKYGVGVDSIDLEAAAEQGVPVVHCPDYGTDTVADQAFALLISAARKIPRIDAAMHSKGWLWPEADVCGVALAGKTLGLIGFGRIGKAMARRGAGFGMRLLVSDPYVSQEGHGLADLEFVPREQVFDEADFLSLHCVLTPETRQIVGTEELARMKRSAILVNVSRGALIDEEALARALAEGQIAGAGLDVFCHEPLEMGHPLLGLENVVLSPHFAFYTHEALERLEKECLNAIEQLLLGKLPPNVKNAHLLEQSTADVSPPTKSAPSAKDWRSAEGDVNTSPRRERWRAEHIGAAAGEWLDRDAEAFLHQSLSTPCLNVLEQVEGSYLVDGEGRRTLDFHGNSVHQVGYGHPRVVEAIKQQLDTLPFCPRRFTNKPAIALAEKLTDLAPGRLSKVLFTPSGTAAIGVALKLARYATGRHKTISMWDSFHGASLDAISIGGEAIFRDGLGPLLPGSMHVPWPRDATDADAIEELMDREGEIGAVVAEPMRCTTVDRPPDAYWKRVRELCDRHGALLIFDEIPLALGRTGRMFCCEHSGVVPDILVIGKGLGGGVMPMAAILANGDLDICGDRALGHYTHEKSPLGAAAALATIEVIETEGLLDRAMELGAQSQQKLRTIAERHPLVTDVRGLGLALAVELSRNGQPATDEAQQVLYECLTRGLSFKVSSGNVLTLMPPLTISEEELASALGILKGALESVAAVS